MKAISQQQAGGPDTLQWSDVPAPSAGPGEVLIAVAAAGVNRADVLQREGRYPPPPGASAVIGLECAGTIAAIGAGVAGAADAERGAGAVGFAIGDEVCALLSGGGYAELVAVPAGQVLPKPRGLSLVEAAAIPEAACTVWSTLFDAARLRAGERLLVHGGASGIGTFTIQLAVARGVRVMATAGSATKCARIRDLGAEQAVNYREQDFVAVVTDHFGGADVILDIVGGDYLARNLAALAPDGRLVVIATQGGRRGELDFATLMGKRASVYAAGLRARPAQQKAAIVAQVHEHVWPLLESSAITPVIEEVVPIADAARAHRILEDGRHVGKVVLTVP